MVIHTKAAGVTFKNGRGPHRQKVVKGCKRGQKLHLVREPDNAVDKRAIAIFARYGLLRRLRQVGFISADLAHDLAPLMDKGKRIDCEVDEVTGGGGMLWWKRNYGLNIRLEYRK